MIYLDATRRIAAVVLALSALAVVVGYAIIGAVWSPTVAAFLAGGVTLGPALTIALRAVEAHRRPPVVVIGRDIPIAKSVAIPASWRAKHREQWPS